MGINKDRVCVSVYLKRHNYEKLKELVLLREETTSMSRWISQKVMKLIDDDLKKLTTKNKKG